MDRAAKNLNDLDRRFVHEVSAGVLRHQDALDDVLAPFTTHGWSRVPDPLKDVLRLGVYQLRYLDRVPPHAAVSTCVEVARNLAGERSSGFVNAVLRKVSSEPSSPLETPSVTLGREYSHPDWLVGRWVDRFGEPETRALLAWNNRRPAIVLQPARQTLDAVRQAIQAAGIPTENVSQGMGLIIEGRRPTMLPGFAEGAFVIQDPAQAWVVRYASIPAGSTVVDACSAPGGKTVALAQTAGLVVAADKRRNRIPRLRQNLKRAGGGSVALLVADAEAPAVSPVDCVLIDAPCSGTGTFARHPDARHRLQAGDIDRLAESQAAILEGSCSAVRPGGLLVYATCSLEPEENEHQVDRFLDGHSEFRRERPDGVPDEMLSPMGDLVILPQLHGMDGAYAARLRRDAG
jgi:16S rRNA (cytosine967-C5)-methyltransferase